MKFLLAIIGGCVLIYLFLDVNAISNKDESQHANDKPIMLSVSVEEQFEVFKELGYTMKEGVTPQFLIDIRAKEYSPPDPNARAFFEEVPFSSFYMYLAQQDAEIEDYYFTDECFWYTLDYLEQVIAYKFFMLRMGKISKGELNFEDVEVNFDDSNIKWISFKVNGLQRKWHLGKDEQVDDSFIQRFHHLNKEFKTKGRYTIFDDGGEAFVLDYATEAEQIQFNKRTGLKRIWLGEGPHFPEPKF